MKYTIGVDFGGGAGKGTLLSQHGDSVCTATREYKTYYPENGWSEHDPEEYYAAFCEIVKEIFQKSGVNPDDVLAVAISAASQTTAYLDDNDKPIRKSIYWTDLRGIKQVEFLKANYFEKIYERCHNCPATSRSLTHLIWIKEAEPENHKRIKKIMFMKDYVRYRLTGDFVTDTIDAMGSELMDVPSNCWSKELCEMTGLPESAFPKILNPTDIIGEITEQAAKETGLSRKTKVVVGSTDTVMEVYANGAIKPGQMTVKLATAGRICVITESNLPNPVLVNYKHVVPGLWYPGTGSKSCAASYRWYRDVLCADEVRRGEEAGKDAYEIMDEMASTIPPGSGNLFFHPYLQGEATPYFDNTLRASFTGIRGYHTKAHFSRALLEGVGYSLKDCLNVLLDMGIECTEAVIIGGGSKSQLWRQIVADMLKIKLKKTKDSDSSLGSAMLAGVAVGMFSSFEDSVDKCVKFENIEVLPDYEVAKVYDNGFKFYKEIHDVLAPVYSEMDKRP